VAAEPIADARLKAGTEIPKYMKSYRRG